MELFILLATFALLIGACVGSFCATHYFLNKHLESIRKEHDQ